MRHKTGMALRGLCRRSCPDLFLGTQPTRTRQSKAYGARGPSALLIAQNLPLAKPICSVPSGPCKPNRRLGCAGYPPTLYSQAAD